MQKTLIEVLQNINILEGYYSCEEALDIVTKLLDVKINHHNLQILSLRIHDECVDCEYHLNRISELKIEKERLKQYVREAKKGGKQVQMNADVLINII